MTPPFCRVDAACTIWEVLALFQSCESTFHSTSVRPYCASTDFNVLLVSPYGGRNSFGATPVADWIAFCVWEISDAICDWLSCVMCGCDQLWFSTHMPASRWLFASAAFPWTLLPWLKNVARRPFCRSALSNVVVVAAMGPSS